VIGCVLGIDPGWSGGAVLLDKKGEILATSDFTNMTEADIICGVKFLSEAKPICYLEKVSAFQGQGVCSVFKLGMIYGLLRGLIIGSCRVIDVTPQKWQKALGCLTHGNKNISKAKAQQLFPGMKVTHHVADALLIAYYGYREEIQIHGKEKIAEPSKETT
jgi:hypothetical protein